MAIKMGKLSIYIFHKTKYDSWKLWTLFAIDYDYRAFEIRPFQWKLGRNYGRYGHWAFGPFHLWTE
jgi:hypothetical protein